MITAALALVALCSGEVRVSNLGELRAALREAGPGTTILLAAGEYGSLYAEGLRGSARTPLVIASADPNSPPVFTGGVHLSEVEHVELRGLHIRGAEHNGLNIDDGGTYETPSHHVVLRELAVRDCGGRGNDDGIKLSGLVDFRVERCTVERWGRGGSALDMVGCARGEVRGCTFRDAERDAASSGVQAKGGSRELALLDCRFEHAGQRAVNLGGSTGLEFFRPEPQGFEARDLRVEGCTFVGSLAPLAFVGVDGASVRWNTFVRPAKWVARILQETTAEGFAPCRAGVFADNLVVYRAAEVATAVNVGPGTAPDTFRFERNYWCCEDRPEAPAPGLPVVERDGRTGPDPRFADRAAGDLRLAADSPARGHGADAWPGRTSHGRAR